MKAQFHRVFATALAVWLAAVTCSLPVATPAAVAPPPILSQEDIAATAGALTPRAASQAQEVPAIATTCEPTVTASVNANVRRGPGTDYGEVGSLLQGASAKLAGKNEADTWWYIEYADAAGGHAWIAKSVTTAACIPEALSVIAAEAPPPAEEEVAEEPPAEEAAAEEEPPAEEAAALPDLSVDQFTITPETPTQGQTAHVHVFVYNHGNANAGPFVVAWYGLSGYHTPSCTWELDGMRAGGGRTLQCDYQFISHYTVTQSSLAVADSTKQVDESNEDNNEATISPFGVNAP